MLILGFKKTQYWAIKLHNKVGKNMNFLQIIKKKLTVDISDISDEVSKQLKSYYLMKRISQ